MESLKRHVKVMCVAGVGCAWAFLVACSDVFG